MIHPSSIPFRQDFLRKISITSGLILVSFIALFVSIGATTTSLLLFALCAAGFLALSRFVDRPWMPSVLLGLAWSLVALLDEGFGPNSAVWLFLIPITLVGWTLYSRSSLRWLIFGISLAIVGVANIESHPLRLVQLPEMEFRFHLAVHFFGALLASVFCVQYLIAMETASHEALAQARERAERASRAKDEFLSHMSHEFRTPLNAIHGFTELLQSQAAARSTGNAPSAECSESLGSIRSATDHLIHIVDDVLDLSRLESGEIRLQTRPFSPVTILSDVRTSLAGRAAEKGLALILEDDAPIPRVVGDKVRWKQILLNLVGNAVKFSRHGEVRIVPLWTETSPEVGTLDVRVVDQGPGVPPELRERIFDRFVRASSVERAETAGTGLGLAISRSLARAMGGDVAVESTSPEGTTFRVTIPFPLAPADIPESGSYTRITPPHPLRGVHVLLCEDNRLNIRLASKLLERLEVTWDVAEDGGKAKELLQAQRYDLVLLDLHMPVANGFEVAAFARCAESAAPNRTVPMLALTADAFEETRQKAKDSGIDDFLAKPYTFEDLSRKTRELLAQRPPVR